MILSVASENWEENKENEVSELPQESETRQPKTQTVEDLYNSTKEMGLECLLADSENISLEEAKRDEKWNIAMKEELKAIERNKT